MVRCAEQRYSAVSEWGSRGGGWEQVPEKNGEKWGLDHSAGQEN